MDPTLESIERLEAEAETQLAGILKRRESRSRTHLEKIIKLNEEYKDAKNFLAYMSRKNESEMMETIRKLQETQDASITYLKQDVLTKQRALAEALANKSDK
jgi:cation transport regulator ChaC